MVGNTHSWRTSKTQTDEGTLRSLQTPVWSPPTTQSRSLEMCPRRRRQATRPLDLVIVEGNMFP